MNQDPDTTHTPTDVQRLQDKLDTEKQKVTSLVDKNDTLENKVHELREAASNLRSQLRHAESRLYEVQNDKEFYKDILRTVLKKQ